MLKLTKKLSFLLPIAVAAFVATPRASATAELILSDGIAADTQTVTVANCGAGCYSFNGSVGNWNINVTTGTSSPGQSPELDLNSIDHRNAASTGQTLTITFSSTGFTPVSPGFMLNVGGTIGAHGTATFSLYGGNSNTLDDQSQKVGSTLSFSNPPANFSGSETAYPPLAVSPYSITEVATLTFGTSAGQASFDYSIDSIPEPAGVLLLGTAILGTVSLVRRKMGQKKA